MKGWPEARASITFELRPGLEAANFWSSKGGREGASETPDGGGNRQVLTELAGVRTELQVRSLGTAFFLSATVTTGGDPKAARATKSLIETLSVEEQIRRLAFQRYVERGSEPGSELADWLQAEAEIRRALDQAVDGASQESFPASDPPAR